jgi:hypothetical protein
MVYVYCCLPTGLGNVNMKNLTILPNFFRCSQQKQSFCGGGLEASGNPDEQPSLTIMMILNNADE